MVALADTNIHKANTLFSCRANVILPIFISNDNDQPAVLRTIFFDGVQYDNTRYAQEPSSLLRPGIMVEYVQPLGEGQESYRCFQKTSLLGYW